MKIGRAEPACSPMSRKLPAASVVAVTFEPPGADAETVQPGMATASVESTLPASVVLPEAMTVNEPLVVLVRSLPSTLAMP